jgi:tRNA pseudouridine38-40 synthase
MRIALCIEYDGSLFSGWQKQNDVDSIQGDIEKALENIALEKLDTYASGRTDTGVHALIQIIHFDTIIERPITAWVRGVNAFLPPSIRVLWAQKVDDTFHARYSASQRHYEYLVYNASMPSALWANKAGWIHDVLDFNKMKEAIDYFKGEHDFSAFRSSECQAKSPIRTITHTSIENYYPFYLFKFSANGFLHHQIRNMMGAILYIGKGNYQSDYINELLLSKDRTKSPPTFLPDGLYLSGVDYDARYVFPFMRRTVNIFDNNHSSLDR